MVQGEGAEEGGEWRDGDGDGDAFGVCWLPAGFRPSVRTGDRSAVTTGERASRWSLARWLVAALALMIPMNERGF